MKAKTFENLIRKVVREEIDYSLRREIKSLKEDLRDELKPTIVEHTERIVEVPEETKHSLYALSVSSSFKAGLDLDLNPVSTLSPGDVNELCVSVIFR